MKREFVMMPVFDRQWRAMRLGDEELQSLQAELLKDPTVGKVIRGTGKLRKMHYALPGRGKSGSSRVLYVDFVFAETIYLIFAYPKNEKDNLTDEECNNIKKLINKLEENLKEKCV